MVYFEDIEQKLSEKAKVIEEFTNKVRNMDKTKDKLADKIWGNKFCWRRQEREKLKIIEMLKLYFYTKLRAGFENTHEIETHIHTKKSDVSVKNVIS